MFDNIIEFSSTERIIENKELYPIPCKLNIPEWFKKLEHTVDDKTIKGCIPFLDTLTTGYLLKTPLELYFFLFIISFVFMCIWVFFHKPFHFKCHYVIFFSLL